MPTATPTPDTDVFQKLPPLPAAEPGKGDFLAKTPQKWTISLLNWLISADGKTVRFTEATPEGKPKANAPVLKKTYPSLHAVYVIRGRLKGDKKGSYLASLVRAIVEGQSGKNVKTKKK